MEERIAHLRSCLLFAVIAAIVLVNPGCTSAPAAMTPKIAEAIGDGTLDHPISKVQASTYYSDAFGHGLKVEVWVSRDPADYSRDIDKEFDGAAKVCAKLAATEWGTRWDFLQVNFFNDFGRMPPRGRPVVGFASVIIKREKIEQLRNRNAGPADYAKNLTLIKGYKDQPDSAELLEW